MPSPKIGLRYLPKRLVGSDAVSLAAGAGAVTCHLGSRWTGARVCTTFREAAGGEHSSWAGSG